MIDSIILDRDVWAVAVEGAIGDWAAYIGSTHGIPPYLKLTHVAEYGSKLPYHIAKVMFPQFDKMFEWRD